MSVTPRTQWEELWKILKTPVQDLLPDKSVFTYDVGIVGPSKVGKTSLIAAMYANARTALSSTGCSLKPSDPTAMRVDRFMNDIRACLQVGHFDPYSIPPTQDPFAYDLRLSSSKGKGLLQFVIVDYPGGLLDPSQRAADANLTHTWELLEGKFSESKVLVVPVDATLVMESKTKDQRAAAMEKLQIEQVERAVRDWAKHRREKGEPALLLLVPVKCESYFSDNGLTTNLAHELRKKTRDFYNPLVTCLREEAETGNDIRVEYHPVDTLGCVQLEHANWEARSGVETEGPIPLEFRANFMVRPLRRQELELHPLGADGLLASMCRLLARQEDARPGWFGQFWRWVWGDGEQLRQAIDALEGLPKGARVKDGF